MSYEVNGKFYVVVWSSNLKRKFLKIFSVHNIRCGHIIASALEYEIRGSYLVSYEDNVIIGGDLELIQCLWKGHTIVVVENLDEYFGEKVNLKQIIESLTEKALDTGGLPAVKKELKQVAHQLEPLVKEFYNLIQELAKTEDCSIPDLVEGSK
ncbi:uncharacterized protein LOC108114726 [Drosophila eugracilis]|uniref:uncharacterized protein LOC108114726 n=1 Tax=Drosophila eugracilis TaxID=29029 RepID=UPI0007E838ED|nr:uncharacterized protein LOC108114726 [Drosophila eugracilis]